VKRLIALAALAAALLAACAGSPRPTELSQADRASLAHAAQQVSSRMKGSEADRARFAEAALALYEYLAAARPGSAPALAAMKETAELAPYLASAYGTTPNEEIISAFMAWDEAVKRPLWKEKKLDRLETEHFTIVTMPGTAAFRDKEYIGRLSEDLLASIQAMVDPAPYSPLRARFAKNLSSLKDGKVEIILPPGSKAFDGFADTANTNWGFAISDDRLAVASSIRLPYYNALSSAILAHELTHVVDIFFKLDLDTAPPIPAKKEGASMGDFAEALKDWAGPVFQRILPNDQAFGEGFAEYVARSVSPMRSAFFAPPDDALRVARARVPLLNDVLAANPSVKDRKVRIIRYAELDSLVSYLIGAYGIERFAAFYTTPPIDERGFAKAYGKGYAAIQAEWKAARGF
jgi:hypothetical protein